MPPGFRVRLKELPEQPGERRISVHWFFLPVGVAYLAAGVIGVRDFRLNERPSSLCWALPCAFLGGLGLLTFVLCQKQIWQGKPPQALFTIRVRPLVLIGGVACCMALCIVLYRLLPGQMVSAIPFIWVVGSALIWNGTVRYFGKHPPEQ